MAGECGGAGISDRVVVSPIAPVDPGKGAGATWITTVLAIGRAVLPFVRLAVTAFAALQLAEMASKLA